MSDDVTGRLEGRLSSRQLADWLFHHRDNDIKVTVHNVNVFIGRARYEPGSDAIILELHDDEELRTAYSFCPDADTRRRMVHAEDSYALLLADLSRKIDAGIGLQDILERLMDHPAAKVATYLTPPKPGPIPKVLTGAALKAVVESAEEDGINPADAVLDHYLDSALPQCLATFHALMDRATDDLELLDRIIDFLNAEISPTSSGSRDDGNATTSPDPDHGPGPKPDPGHGHGRSSGPGRNTGPGHSD